MCLNMEKCHCRRSLPTIWVLMDDKILFTLLNYAAFNRWCSLFELLDLVDRIIEGFLIFNHSVCRNRSLFLIYLRMCIRHQSIGLASDLPKHLAPLCYGHWIAFLMTLQFTWELPRDQKR